MQSSQHSEPSREARQRLPVSGKRAGGWAAQKHSKAAKLQAGPGQSSLRAFMKPQTVQKSASAASHASEQNQNPQDSRAPEEMSAAAAAAAREGQRDAAGSGVGDGGTQAGAGSAAACAAPKPGLSEGQAANGRGAHPAVSAAHAGGNSNAVGQMQTWNELQAEGMAGGDDYLAEAAANWDGDSGERLLPQSTNCAE